MTNNKAKINFTELKNILHDIGKTRLKQLINEYQIKNEKHGVMILYLITDVIQLKDDLDQRYIYNKNNRIETPEILSLGILNPSTIFKKILKQPLDRIYEFKYTSYFYDRKEIEEYLIERKSVRKAFGIKDIQEELGLTHYKSTQEVINITKIIPIPLKYYNNKLKYYRIDDVKKIKELILQRYEFNKINRLSHNQISEKFKLTNASISKLKPIKTTALDRIHEFHKCTFLYDKQQVMDYANQTSVPFETYSTSEVKTVLNFYDSNLLFRYLKKLYINPIDLNGVSSMRWDKKAIDELSIKKNGLLEIYNNKFFTIPEFETNFNIDFKSVKRAFEKINQEIKYYEIPPEIKLDKYAKLSLLLAFEDLEFLLKILINNTYLGNHSEIIEKRDIFLKNSDFNLLSIKHERESGVNFLLKDLNSKKTQIFIKHTEIPNIETLKKEIDKMISNKKYRSNYLISKEQILKKYNISNRIFKFHRDLNCEKVKFIRKLSLTFYGLKNIENLFKELINSQKELLETHYSIGDLNNMGLHYSSAIFSKFRFIEVPLSLKFGLLKKSKILYSKIDADKKIEEIRLRDFFIKYKNREDLLLLPSKVFEEIIETLKVDFNMCKNSTRVNQTFILWKRYVKEKLDTSHGNKFNIYNDMTVFAKLTHILSEKVQERDIFLYTVDEIEEILFQEDIFKTWRLYLITFLIFITSKRITKYKVEELLNLRKNIVADCKPRETTVFTTEEFIALINYVSDTPYHKDAAIKEFISPKKGKRKYYEYSSVWLYVLMHLNNAWRSTDIIEKIPRISLPNSIDSIEKFRDHELSSEERRSILFELSGKLMDIHHNKNLKKAYFFCSEKLEEPLVNALILCELKCRLERPLVNNLIKLEDSNNLGKQGGLHKVFFENFDIPGFVFTSLKANRSYIKTLKSVLNQLNSDNVMTILELQRNHGSFDVTKRYTPISTEEANMILKRLASVGYFGYTYTLLTNMLLGKQGVEVTTNSIVLLKEVFGDIYKVENFITQINNIEKANLNVFEYFEKLEINELENLLGLISLGQKPAKEDHWQCVLGDCMYLDRNCESCPFAIPNYYVLNSILKKLTKHIDDYESNFGLGIEGELVKSSKLIHRYLLILSSAKKKFGETAISSFLGYDYTIFKEKLNTLDEFKHYLYLREDNYE